jgi:hypothetical protein
LNAVIVVASLQILQNDFDVVSFTVALGKDYSQLARLGHVSRAQITQIMNLLLLAPDIQEEILFLPKTVAGHGPIKLKHL